LSGASTGKITALWYKYRRVPKKKNRAPVKKKNGIILKFMINYL